MEQVLEGEAQKPISAAAKLGYGLKAYLTDWKNLLGHSLLGVCFLVLAIWAPINGWVKLAVVACLIGFNIRRMKRKKNAASIADSEVVKK
ncbi:MAG: hypothetical protein HGA54_03750 [Actinobacteria bacterium]|nr:hypothetical protein [Actinomycetota bacterium]